MAYERRQFKGNAAACTLDGDILSNSTTITLAGDYSSWPDGSTGKFGITIDREGTAEKLLGNSRTGNTVLLASSADRGLDDTVATGHLGGVSVEHTTFKRDFDEANAHIADTTLDHHTQYAKTNGSRAITGAATFNSTVHVVGAATFDATVVAASEITARSGATQNTEIGASGPGGQAGIRLGSGIGTYDVNFYRESAGKGRMNGKLQVDSDIYVGDTDVTLRRSAATTLSVLLSATERYKFAVPNGGDTSGFYLTFDTGGGLVLKQVVRGAADSGGAGFRMLRTTN